MSEAQGGETEWTKESLEERINQQKDLGQRILALRNTGYSYTPQELQAAEFDPNDKRPVWEVRMCDCGQYGGIRFLTRNPIPLVHYFALQYRLGRRGTIFITKYKADSRALNKYRRWLLNQDHQPYEEIRQHVEEKQCMIPISMKFAKLVKHLPTRREWNMRRPYGTPKKTTKKNCDAWAIMAHIRNPATKYGKETAFWPQRH